MAPSRRAPAVRPGRPPTPLLATSPIRGESGACSYKRDRCAIQREQSGGLPNPERRSVVEGAEPAGGRRHRQAPRSTAPTQPKWGTETEACFEWNTLQGARPRAVVAQDANLPPGRERADGQLRWGKGFADDRQLFGVESHEPGARRVHRRRIGAEGHDPSGVRIGVQRAGALACDNAVHEGEVHLGALGPEGAVGLAV